MEKDNASTSEKTAIQDILNDCGNLKENVTDLSVYFKEAFQRIRSDAEDVKSNMESGSTLKIGRKAVQPLVELKNLAAEVFSNVTNNEVKYLHQEIDPTPFWTHINEIKKMNGETREVLNLLESLKDSIGKLNELEKTQKQNINADESCASSVSIASDPSISEFSLFDDNSSTNAATSSPYLEKKKEKGAVDHSETKEPSI